MAEVGANTSAAAGEVPDTLAPSVPEVLSKNSRRTLVYLKAMTREHTYLNATPLELANMLHKK